MSKTKKRNKEFLLSFFDKEPKYQVKEINGFIIVKRWNGKDNVWEPAIYTKESYKREQNWQGSQKQLIN